MDYSTSYYSQLKWSQDAKARASQLKEEAESQSKPTFKPHIFTKTVAKKMEGPVAELNEKSGSNYVKRQQKARQEKELEQDRFEKLGKVSQTPKPKAPVELPAALRTADLSNAADILGMTAAPDEEFGHHFAHEDDIYDDSLLERETLVEMFERERREWHNERVKLVHCIHIQQLELMQRATAAHERAGDIAKEFARAIEGFEERLVSIETNVQKEIMAIKVLAENLKVASSTANTTVDIRLSGMEKGIDTIIQRLGTVQTTSQPSIQARR